MRARNALTDAEQVIIRDEAAQGAGTPRIRKALRAHGFARGSKSIDDFICDNNIATRRARGSYAPSSHTHLCVFCDWRGDPSDYYGHWRTQHRRRAGYTHTELTGERPRA